jgi:hypothetical protein
MNASFAMILPCVTLCRGGFIYPPTLIASPAMPPSLAMMAAITLSLAADHRYPSYRIVGG